MSGRIPALFAIVFGAAWAGPALGQARIEAPDVQAARGTSGFFDIVVNPNGGTVQNLKGFAVSVALTPGTPQTSVRFATPFILTPANYVFDSIAGGLPGDGGGSGPYQVNAGADVAANQSRTFNTTRGLIRVPYEVAANAPLNSAYVVGFNPTFTALTNSAGNDLVYTIRPGTITVVPEPAAGLAAAGAVVLGMLGRRRRAGRGTCQHDTRKS